MQGILYLAIGEGESAWDENIPEPLPTAAGLAKEVARRKLVEGRIIYLDVTGPSEKPTNQLEVTAIFRGEEFAW